MPSGPPPAARRRRGTGAEDQRETHLRGILRHLRDHGPSSRSELAEHCGLAPSTVSALVEELRSRRLVRELRGQRSAGAGRPPRPVALDGEPWCVLGVGVDVRGVDVLATTVGGRELWSASLPEPLPPGGGEAGWAALREVLAAQLRRVPPRTRLVSVVLGLPGYVATDRGTVGWSSALDWEGLPLRGLVRELLADAGLPRAAVGVATDCHLAGLHAVRAELSTPPPHVAVYLGGLRELGGAVVVDGAVFGGAGGAAGDLGHTVVDPHGPRCRCGRYGCLEALVGLTALLQSTGLLPHAEAERLSANDPGAALATLLAAAEAGEPRVRAALAEAGDTLGVAVDTLLGTLNPDVVVLGGSLGVLRAHLLGRVEQRTHRRTALPAYAGTTVVALGEIGARVVAGAALAARDACLADPVGLTSVLEPPRSAAPGPGLRPR